MPEPVIHWAEWSEQHGYIPSCQWPQPSAGEIELIDPFAVTCERCGVME